jgi:hypothetical protein
MRMKHWHGVVALGMVIALAGCAGSGEPETIVETVYVTPEPTVAQGDVDVAEPDTSVAEVASDETPADDATSCLVISSKPKKKWEDKGKSYQQLWLYMNFTIENACDKRVKSVKFNWTALDEFGEEWPGGYEFVDAIRADAGKTWQQESNFGYRHYDSDRNFAVVERLTEDEIVPQISDVRVVFSDGTTIGSTS